MFYDIFYTSSLGGYATAPSKCDANTCRIDLKHHEVNLYRTNIAVVTRTNIERLMPEGWSWGEVQGIFDCSGSSKLTSLKGGPRAVGRYYDCRCCESLINLDYGPSVVGTEDGRGDFYYDDRFCPDMGGL